MGTPIGGGASVMSGMVVQVVIVEVVIVEVVLLLNVGCIFTLEVFCEDKSNFNSSIAVLSPPSSASLGLIPCASNSSSLQQQERGEREKMMLVQSQAI